uniref:Uncharacterized protein n=1 Tax=Anopheles minimus TaxID=112268 RepID=A0A182WPA2_9DIPT
MMTRRLHLRLGEVVSSAINNISGLC